MKMNIEDKISRLKTALNAAPDVNDAFISFNNRKMNGIPSVSLLPILTCPNCDCKDGCYACKMCMLYKSVLNSYAKNTRLAINHTERFFDSVRHQLNGINTYRLFRWHVSGDIINADYFAGMVDVAKATPQTQFLAFTKRFNVVNEWLDANGELPQNFTVIFSAWDDDFKVPNPHNLPVAYCRSKAFKCDNIPATAQECDGDCANCRKCFNLQKGESVVFNQH